MTIKITSPQVEALFRQRMQSGQFQTPEQLLHFLLKAIPSPDARTGADLLAAMQACPFPEFEIEPQRYPSPLVRHIPL